MGSSSTRRAHTSPSTSGHQVGPVQPGSCGCFRLSAGLTAVTAHCRHSARQKTLLHCFRNYTGYVSRSTSSSGRVFWHITVCMEQHQRIWQTACGRHQMSSLVVVFVLSTARRCWCRQLVGQLSATVRYMWLQRGHGTGCQHRPRPPPLW